MKKTLLTGLAALLASTGLANAQGVVNLYNWGNYTSPEMIAKFEAETGIKVNVTDYDSNDTALARIRQGGHGFDIVVPSNSYMQTWISEGLVIPLDKSIVANHGNIAPEWMDVDFDPGRTYSVPWQWGTTGVVVNTDHFSGDYNTAEIIFNPPEQLRGKINVIPEMSDVMNIAIYYAGGEACTTDMEVMRKVRDTLVAAKPHWKALDYGTVDAYAAGDFSAGIYWNGATMRARLQNDKIAYGYPVTGYPIWMDSATVLADAQNKENAMKFINFILQPEHAAMISNFARYANGVTGSEAFMDEVMRDAPEIVVPAALVAAGKFSPACPQEVNDLQSRIWTEVLQ
jgi:spermidine/putrescine transport system substrate-binding protein